MPWLAGYPRDQVNWHPTIDRSKCVQCGMCMNCGKKVYAWTEKGAVVVNPNACVIGCMTCANLCLGNAINFPDLKVLRDLYKKEGIWGKVKKQMTEEGVLSISAQQTEKSSGQE